MSTHAQISAKLMRYMDVSTSQITFVYGGDIWVMPKAGGTAIQLTHSPGEESWPRFSPDGTEIAYTASYQGNMDVYVIPVSGGMPVRVTYQSHPDRMIDWHPDGQKLLFASRREMGQRSSRQFYLVDKNGGFPEKLPIPYGELASFSPDGNHLAYITKITENYPFKRYRGGLASDIIIFDLINKKAENITNNDANDGKPAWVGNNVYFLSDQGNNMRLNLYAYNTTTKTSQQLTHFKDFDISHMSAGPSDIVFEAGGILYLMDLNTMDYKMVDVNVVSDLSLEMPHKEDVGRSISNMTASPEGKRIVFEARGELFDVPVKEGYSLNMTKTSGAFDRDPAWSPDGKTIAFWSDKSGEYEIYFYDVKNKTQKKVTNRNKGFGYKLYWSPDSKKIAFIDEKNDLNILNTESGVVIVADNMYWNVGHGGRQGWSVNWSADSEWITYDKGMENANNAIMVYEVSSQTVRQITSGFYSDFNPVFSTDGKYIFFGTNRSLNAAYSDMGDGTWIYPNSTQVAAIALQKDAPSLLSPKYDVYEVKEEKKEEDEDEEKKEEDKSDEEKEAKEEEKLTIDFQDIESRIMILPPDAGNIGTIWAFDGKIVYRRFPNTGSNSRSSSLMVYDLKDREEKEVMGDVQGAVLTADGESILIRSKGRYGIIKPAPGQKIEDAIPTSGLVMDLIPKEEWKQLFHDAWRRHRDFFYDPDMHGLDWEDVREKYGALIEDARTRWDVTNIMSNMAAELSAGHTYTFGGDAESVKPVMTGYLGIDWEVENNKYKIARIIKPASWDTEVRSPFNSPGMEVSEGDFIHSVNGLSITSNKDPYAAFSGLSGETVLLSISNTGMEKDAKEVVVQLLTQGEETRLRYLEWIENNRKMVDQLSDGKLGYVYMSNTSGRGQLELVRMYYGQLDKEGFIIDERFNGGGQLADRFLELITKPVVYNLHWRHGRDHTWPVKTNTGPLGMLINGWAGSGGDGLPWAFQELEAGPIVGERTLGILVGPATGHRLIDGGGITVPGARLYDNDGHWFWEGEGVSPDIEVWDDPNILVQGRDPQIERVVQEVLKNLKTQSPKMTPAPAAEDRTAQGLNGNR